MAIYSIARRTTNTTTAQSAHAIVTTSTDRAAIVETGATTTGGVASVFSLGRPAANGVGATSPVTVLAEDPAGPAGTVTSVLAWGTSSPTAPTNDFRRFALPATTVGVGLIFTFPRGLLVAVSSNFVLQNVGTTGAVDSYFVVDE
jgi:hypothetical protein